MKIFLFNDIISEEVFDDERSHLFVELTDHFFRMVFFSKSVETMKAKVITKFNRDPVRN